MKQKHLSIFLIILLFTACKTQYNTPQEALEYRHSWLTVKETNKKISISKLKQDVNIIYATLNSVHPNIFNSYSKKEFEDLVVQIKNKITYPLTRKDFYILIAPLISKINDAHTYIQFPDEEFSQYINKNGLLFPIKIEILDDKLLIKENYKGLKKGANILSINGINSSELISNMVKYETGESINYRRKLVEFRFPHYLWLLYDFKNTFLIKTKDKNIEINGKKYNEINNQTANQNASKSYFYKSLDNKTSLIKISSFSNHIDTFSIFLDTTFKKIKEEKTKNLIIDIRGNNGGNDALVIAFINYFHNKPYCIYSKSKWKKSKQYQKFIKGIKLDVDLSDYYKTTNGQFLTSVEKNNISSVEENYFNGNIYLLIDVHTFSAGVNLAMVIKDYNIGIIIGEETGNHATSFGNVYPFDLPNSKLSIRCSTSMYVRPSGDENPGGVKPDYYVQANENIINFTLNLINKK